MNQISLIITISLIANCCFSAIWNCPSNNRYEHKNPESNEGAIWCADEGGYCTGKGRVYYGSALTWTFKDVTGNGIRCDNNAFGCDPLYLFKKRCYIKPEPSDTIQYCCGGTLSIGGIFTIEIDYNQGTEREVRDEINEQIESNGGSGFITEQQVFDQICSQNLNNC